MTSNLFHQLVNITNTSTFFRILYFTATTIISFFILYFLQNCRLTIHSVVLFNISFGIFKTVTHKVIALKIILLGWSWR